MNASKNCEDSHHSKTLCSKRLFCEQSGTQNNSLHYSFPYHDLETHKPNFTESNGSLNTSQQRILEDLKRLLDTKMHLINSHEMTILQCKKSFEKECHNLLKEVSEIIHTKIVIPVMQIHEAYFHSAMTKIKTEQRRYKRIAERIGNYMELLRTSTIQQSFVPMLEIRILVNTLNEKVILNTVPSFSFENIKDAIISHIKGIRLKLKIKNSSLNSYNKIYCINDIEKVSYKVDAFSENVKAYFQHKYSYVKFRNRIIQTQGHPTISSKSIYPLPVYCDGQTNALVNAYDLCVYSLGISQTNSSCFKMELNSGWISIPSLVVKRAKYYGLLLGNVIYCFGEDSRNRFQYYEMLDIFEEQAGWKMGVYEISRILIRPLRAIFPISPSQIFISGINHYSIINAYRSPAVTVVVNGSEIGEVIAETPSLSFRGRHYMWDGINAYYFRISANPIYTTHIQYKRRYNIFY